MADYADGRYSQRHSCRLKRRCHAIGGPRPAAISPVPQRIYHYQAPFEVDAFYASARAFGAPPIFMMQESEDIKLLDTDIFSIHFASRIFYARPVPMR